MTPPDSDAPKKRTPEEWRKLADEERRGTEQGMAFLDAIEREGCMARVKPDSDAREVRRCNFDYCMRPKGHTGAHVTAGAESVFVSRSLAQRILAALEHAAARTWDDNESRQLRLLRDELRVVIGK